MGGNGFGDVRIANQVFAEQHGNVTQLGLDDLEDEGRKVRPNQVLTRKTQKVFFQKVISALDFTPIKKQ